ncbi:sulfotransferase domain-containing protein [Roseovarius sp. E0-M6]|uniref:sulfotransferase domain-containing protein n=1 Tax=Roseovarius sp. E0-M6 TaxID=3127118 RepID=UPI0030105ED8
MKKSIIWLASYPKSGNTWTRIFLANYLMNWEKPVPINQVHRFGMGDSIPKMYHMVAGKEIDINNMHLTLGLRDRVLRGVVANNSDVNFVKTHNQRGSLYGVEMIPEKYTRSAIYIMRNPLDVAVSYARHYNISYDLTAEAFCRSDTLNGPDPSSVVQFLGSWTDHVKSWTRFSQFHKVIVRYEDLLDDPETHFTKMLKLVGVPVDPDRLKKAIRFSSFKEVAAQEAEYGFAEKPDSAEKFFNSGQSGKWRDKLPKKVVDQIVKVNGPTMEKYGYLP